MRLPQPLGCESDRIESVMTSGTELPWEELHENLRGFVGRRVRNPSDVEDLVQRVLLQIYKGLGSLRDAERLHAWVYRAARNAIADYYRSPALRRELPAGDAQDVAANPAAEPPEAEVQDDETALFELASCMTPLLRQLPAPYLDALTLTDLQGMNQADAARRTGVSLSAMKSRVQRGRKQLKAILEECCRIEIDRRGGVMGYEARREGACDSCGPCADCNNGPRAPTQEALDGESRLGGARHTGRATPH
jgi:RNA polymerase sigma-70 factor (ECF subfamily)